MVHAARRSTHTALRGNDELARWLAVGALALATILFLLIVFQ